MMRFSIWSLIPRPWRPPISLARSTDSTWSSSLAVDPHRPAALEAIVTSSVAISTAGSQWATPMIGETISIVVDSSSSDLASCVAPQMLASVEYAFSLGSR